MTSYYILVTGQESSGSFVRFMADGSFTIGLDLWQTLWESTYTAFKSSREYFANDIYRALMWTADSEFDLSVTYRDGDDSAVVNVPIARDCSSKGYFEVTGLRAKVE
jgi:hypothetical protein